MLAKFDLVDSKAASRKQDVEEILNQLQVAFIVTIVPIGYHLNIKITYQEDG